jgi:hypothetical protein
MSPLGHAQPSLVFADKAGAHLSGAPIIAPQPLECAAGLVCNCLSLKNLNYSSEYEITKI